MFDIGDVLDLNLDPKTLNLIVFFFPSLEINSVISTYLKIVLDRILPNSFSYSILREISTLLNKDACIYKHAQLVKWARI